MSSLVFDAYIKIAGSDNIYFEKVEKFPLLRTSAISEAIVVRTILLNCETSYYAPIWENCYKETWTQDSWAKSDSKLNPNIFACLSKEWSYQATRLNDYERRQLLVEIDVLVTLALGLKLGDLLEFYELQFPVFSNYEANTFYDKNGKIVFTVNKSLTGIGLSKSDFASVSALAHGVVEKEFDDLAFSDDAIHRSIKYEAPFDSCDRIADYRQAWGFFSERYGIGDEK